MISLHPTFKYLRNIFNEPLTSEFIKKSKESKNTPSLFNFYKFSIFIFCTICTANNQILILVKLFIEVFNLFSKTVHCSIILNIVCSVSLLKHIFQKIYISVYFHITNIANAVKPPIIPAIKVDIIPLTI